jgi:uncharacterized OsmC-like protein
VSIKDAVAQASEYLTQHPDEARYRDSEARARLLTGLRTEVRGPGGERLATDMPTGIGGMASKPSPGWYFRAAAASCVTTLIAIRAASLGIDVRSLEVAVDSESDDRGLLGLDRSISAGPLSTRVEVAIDAGPADATTIDELVAWAVDHCPVTDAIGRAVPIEVRRL